MCDEKNCEETDVKNVSATTTTETSEGQSPYTKVVRKQIDHYGKQPVSRKNLLNMTAIIMAALADEEGTVDDKKEAVLQGLTEYIDYKMAKNESGETFKAIIKDELPAVMDLLYEVSFSQLRLHKSKTWRKVLCCGC